MEDSTGYFKFHVSDVKPCDHLWNIFNVDSFLNNSIKNLPFACAVGTSTVYAGLTIPSYSEFPTAPCHILIEL